MVTGRAVLERVVGGGIRCWRLIAKPAGWLARLSEWASRIELASHARWQAPGGILGAEHPSAAVGSASS